MFTTPHAIYACPEKPVARAEYLGAESVMACICRPAYSRRQYAGYAFQPFSETDFW